MRFGKPGQKLKAPRKSTTYFRGTLLKVFRKRTRVWFVKPKSQHDQHAAELIGVESVMSIGTVRTFGNSFRGALLKVVSSVGSCWICLNDLKNLEDQ